MVAWELWRLAMASGRTPREALLDPDLAFNLTVMRAHDEYRRLRLAFSIHAPGADPLGALLQRLYEDG